MNKRSCFLKPLDLSAGLGEDFSAWKSGFVREVFPMLKGEVAVRELEKRTPSSGSGACECGQQAGQCSRGHVKTTHTEEVSNLAGNLGNRKHYDQG